MNSELPAEESLYHAARELTDPAGRAAFLEQACQGDAAMRARIERLLERGSEADGFFARNAITLHRLREFSGDDATQISAPAEGAGEFIGPYKLREQIGEGGFGTVWVADQEQPVKRRVALKIIKLGMDTKEVISRFEQERQALAMMEHPNIARVLDAGATPAGRLYFAMELVRGIKITDYCDQQELSTEERLKLFIHVCQAVQHAHQKGIIHRDLKPSNILVTVNDGEAVPKVIDFGVAKATQGRLAENTVYTQFQQMVGTPLYMSPEQAGMTSVDIDTRSDIYSLGVLLYELLTGGTPIEQQTLARAGVDEIRRVIREVDPLRPSMRVRTLQGEELTSTARRRHVEPGKLPAVLSGDLDWIVMKAIEKDRARRYETANAFATDIRRFLADEPVSARPPSAAYQFRKFARRHRTAMGAAAAIFAVLAAATVVSAWQAIRARSAEDMATRRLAEVAAERDAKDKARVEADKARDEAEGVSRFLTELFQSPDPARDGRNVTVAEMLDRAAEKLDADLADQPMRRARLQGTPGWTYQEMGLYDRAVPLLEKARDYYLAVSGAEHRDTVLAMHNLAWAYFRNGQVDEALKLKDRVMPLCRKVLGPEHQDMLTAMGYLAQSGPGKGPKDEALKQRETVLTLSRQVGAEHPSTVWALGSLALYYTRADRPAEALPTYEQLVPLSRKVLGAENPYTLWALQGLSDAYETDGRWDEAVKLGEEVLALRRKVLSPEHPDTLTAVNNLAVACAAAGRMEQALKLRQELVALNSRVRGPAHTDSLIAMKKLARLYSTAGEHDKAVAVSTEVLEICRATHGLENVETVMGMSALGDARYEAGQRDEAMRLRRDALALFQKVKGREYSATLREMGALAESWMDLRQYAEADVLLSEALELTRKSGKTYDLEARLLEMAELRFRQKKYPEAEALYRERIESRRNRTGWEKSTTVFDSNVSLGRLYTDWAWDERTVNSKAAHERALRGEALLREALATRLRDPSAAVQRKTEVESRLGGALVTVAFTDAELTAATREPKLIAAETLLLQSHADMEKNRAGLRGRRDGVERLVRLYTAWENPDKLAAWQQKLETLDQPESAGPPASARAGGK